MKVKEFISKTELLCEHCGKDLLTDPASGIFVTWTTKHKSYNLKKFYQKAYYCCKGACNEAMKIKSRNQGLIYNEQEDLSVYMNPLTYINKSVLWMDLLNQGVTLKPAAFDKLNNLFTVAFIEVSRDMTNKEVTEAKYRVANGIDSIL